MGINDWGQDSYWGSKTTPQSKKDGLVKNILYIRSLDTSGWLLIKLEPNGGNVSVPEYTKVILQKEANGRVYFLVKEGQYANRTASLKKVNTASKICFGGSVNGNPSPAIVFFVFGVTVNFIKLYKFNDFICIGFELMLFSKLSIPLIVVP